MTHIDEATLTAYLMNRELDDAGRREVESHLSSCPQCARNMESWRLSFLNLNHLLPSSQPIVPAAANRDVLIPLGPTGETREFKPPIWSSWIGAVMALSILLAGGTAVALKWAPRPVKSGQAAPGTVEGMPPAPGLVSESAGDSVVADTLGADRSEQREPESGTREHRTAPPPPPPAIAPVPIDSLPAAEIPLTMPEFRRIDRAAASRAMQGRLLELRGFEAEAWEIGPGGSVPGAYPTAQVIRQISRIDDQVILFDQQLLPRGIRLPPEPGDTLITTTADGVTVAIWTLDDGRRLSLAAVFPRESLLELVRHVQ